MRSLQYILSAGLLVLAANTSEAQNTILMGKITNGHDKPVADALVRLSKTGSAPVETTSDKDGLYYSPVLNPDTYNVTIVLNGKALKAKSVQVMPMDKDKTYCNFTITGDKVKTEQTTTDPCVATLDAHSEIDNKQIVDMQANGNKMVSADKSIDKTKMPATEHVVINSKDIQGAGVPQSMLMGKVTDSHGRPVDGAIVRISKPGMKAIETASQKDGLYYSGMLAPDTYNVTVVMNGTPGKVKSITLPAMGNEHKYYNFKMKGSGMETEETTEDPFLATVSGKLQVDNSTDGGTGRSMYIQRKADVQKPAEKTK